MTGAPLIKGQAFVRITGFSGHAVIPAATPLVHLNYFDGRFLRAADLQLEQRGLRQLVELSNQAGGPGVVNGFDCTLQSGGRIALGSGLAIDPEGRVLLLPEAVTLDIADLIEKSRTRPGARLKQRKPVAGGGAFGPCEIRAAGEPAEVIEGAALYLVTIGHVEAHCGEEDVFGKLCEDACITSTDRPYLLEGVVVRALPLTLRTPLATSSAVALTGAHLRSLVASAYFADEDTRLADLISRPGLASDAWCLGARDPDERTDVPVALLARAGATTLFLDAWIARRERIEPPPRRYWARRMAMRPWPSFLAQVLQFQCHLSELFRDGPKPGVGTDPCEEPRSVIRAASRTMDEVVRFYDEVSQRLERAGEVLGDAAIAGGRTALESLRSKLRASGEPVLATLGERVLITGGIVEVPPAGYLPVVPDVMIGVEEQVRRLLGDGVDLRFCIVRPDFVPDAVEEAQHMERVSLLEGLDDPERKPELDILVPDGVLRSQPSSAAQGGFSGQVDLSESPVPQTGGNDEALPVFPGVGRVEVLPSGGGAFYFAGVSSTERAVPVVEAIQRMRAVFAAPVNDSALEVASAIDDEISRASAVPSPLASRLHRAARAARVAIGRAVGEAAEEVAAPGFTPGERPFATLWLSLRTERDALALEPGETTPMALRLIVAVHRNRNLAVDCQLHGTLSVTGRDGAERVVTGKFSGLTSRRVLVPDAAPDVIATTSAYNVEIRHQRLAERDATVVNLTFPDNPQAGIRAQIARQGRPLEVNADVTMFFPLQAEAVTQPSQRLAGAQLRADADALTVGGRHHTRALQVFDVLAAALDQPAFADTAARSMFPPVPTPAPSARIVATRDWVLFHRRRSKVCTTLEPQPQPVPARTYQLYHLALENVGEAERVQGLLARGDSLANFPLHRFARVEFAGGQASLLSDAALLLSDWRSAGPSDQLIRSLLASAPAAAADGAALARARLDRLHRALAETTPLHPDAVTELLREVPPDLAVERTDGIGIFLTVPEIVERTHCHQAFWLDPRQEFPRPNDDEPFAAILDRLVADELAQELGTVTFPAESVEPSRGLDVMIENWNGTAQSCPPQTIHVFARRGDAAAGTLELRRRRTHLLLNAFVQLDAIEDVVFHDTEEVPGPCAVITLIRPHTVCFEVHYHIATANTEGQIRELIAAEELGRILDRDDVVPGGRILFCARSNEAVSSELDEIQGLRLGRFTVWFRRDDPRVGPEQEFIQDRADKIAAAMGLEFGEDLFQPIATEQGLPSDCPFVVFMILEEG